ncbi:MAG: hypothetical protein ABIH21_02060 [Patescibacteria group bacterium]
MLRFFKHIFLFIIACAFEISFLHLLPGVFAFIPFVFIISIYEIQHRQNQTFFWWLVAYGTIIEIFNIGASPHEWIRYIVLLVGVRFLSRYVFVGNSFYSVVSCTALSYILFSFTGFVLYFISWLGGSQNIFWAKILFGDIMTLIVSIILISIIFITVPRINKRTFFPHTRN